MIQIIQDCLDVLFLLFATRVRCSFIHTEWIFLSVLFLFYSLLMMMMMHNSIMRSASKIDRVDVLSSTDPMNFVPSVGYFTVS